MSPCPTGWCGHPCTCASAYAHMDQDEAKALKKICEDRIRVLTEEERSKALGEPLKEFPTIEVHIKAIRFSGEILKVHHLLDQVVVKPDSQSIASLSGVLTVVREGDKILFERGSDNSNRNTIRWEVLRYKGEVSVSIEGTGAIDAAFASLTPSIIHLPEDY